MLRRAFRPIGAVKAPFGRAAIFSTEGRSPGHLNRSV